MATFMLLLLSCCKARLRNGLHYKFCGTYLCHMLDLRNILLSKCIPGDWSSKRNQCYLGFLAHPQWGCILSSICRLLLFHSLQFFLQLLINPPWIHWCFNALFTSKNFNQFLISCWFIDLYPWFPHHFQEGVLSYHYSCLLWPVGLSLNLFLTGETWSLAYIPPPFSVIIHQNYVQKRNNGRVTDLSWVEGMDSAPQTEK